MRQPWRRDVTRMISDQGPGEALRKVLGMAARQCMDRKRALAHIREWAQTPIEVDERDKFQDITEDEVPSPHDGNLARF